MYLLDRLEESSNNRGEQIALNFEEGLLSYRDLWKKSGRLANWIIKNFGQGKEPIVVYGHKSTLMIVCFLACVKAGRPYCPIDISMAEERVKEIVDATCGPIVLDTINDEEKIKGIIETTDEEVDKRFWVKDQDTFYIIFTSGSTGKPKGVQITYDNLNNFLKWSQGLGVTNPVKNSRVFLNQAPFSFDLSVMDLYTSLYTGGTLWSLDKKTQLEGNLLMERLAEGKINVWVSTPSFVDMCLGDKNFDQKKISEIQCFLFCGETLSKKTVKSLRQRFPKAKIINTYGPTESTVAVTSVEITGEILEENDVLPVGNVKPGSEILIKNAEGDICKDGEKGEIVICGDTVASGYFNDKEKTDKVFGAGENPSYKTGDEGYILKGQVYCVGRLDQQIKFHGYRIELGDIEKNLLALPEIKGAVVVPRKRNGVIKNLVAFVVGDGPSESKTFEDSQNIRTALKKRLPEYMVPKKVSFIDKFPMTGNGKINRKELEERV